MRALQVKEVWVGSGETRRRFVVCRYQEEVRRDQTVASARSASPPLLDARFDLRSTRRRPRLVVRYLEGEHVRYAKAA